MRRTGLYCSVNALAVLLILPGNTPPPNRTVCTVINAMTRNTQRVRLEIEWIMNAVRNVLTACDSYRAARQAKCLALAWNRARYSS